MIQSSDSKTPRLRARRAIGGRALLAALLLLLAPSRSEAQDAAPLAWEQVGGASIKVVSLLLSADTAMYAGGYEGVYLADLPFSEWTLISDDVIFVDVYEASTGTLYAVQRAIARSEDRGRTWVGIQSEVFGVIEVPPDAPGGQATVAAVNGRGVIRSTDDGITWTPHSVGVPPLDQLFIHDFAYGPASLQRPVGTLVGVGTGGVASSTDGGLTWQATNLVAPFGYLGDHAAYSPLDDTFYVVLNGRPPDGGDPLGNVYASADGAAWALRGRIPAEGDESPARIVVAPDGVLWSVFPGRIDGPVWASTDGGRTWVERGRIDGTAVVGAPLRMQDLAIGPEGRLWIGCTSLPGPNTPGAVLRSTEAVVAVASEDGPGRPDGPALRLGAAYPNPAGGATALPLSLRKPGRVRVAVYDLLGREVAVLADRAFAAGDHVLAVRAGAVAPGAYLVRARGAGGSASGRFTVAR